jgi:hypothetical protein
LNFRILTKEKNKSKNNKAEIVIKRFNLVEIPKDIFCILWTSMEEGKIIPAFARYLGSIETGNIIPLNITENKNIAIDIICPICAFKAIPIKVPTDIVARIKRNKTAINSIILEGDFALKINGDVNIINSDVIRECKNLPKALVNNIE